MNLLAKALWWIAVTAICVAFLFCGVGMAAVDEWVVHDWRSIAPQKASLLASLAGAFAVCATLWMTGTLVNRMFEDMRNRDPDLAYDVDGNCEFPDSPNKPR